MLDHLHAFKIYLGTCRGTHHVREADRRDIVYTTDIQFSNIDNNKENVNQFSN